MAGALTLYLLVVAGMVVCLAGAYVYYEAAAMPNSALPAGLTPRDGAAITVVTLVVVVAMGFLGDVTFFDPETDVRGVGMLVLGSSIPLVLGLAGLASCRTFVRRWRRLHPDDDVPTGSLSPGAAACTGEVTDAAVDSAPVTGREACCWSWNVEVLDPHGVGDVGQREQWVVRDGGVGGVRFAVDDGSGRVCVDPDDATVDLAATRTLALDADESLSADFPNPAPKVERDHRDKPRRYEESVVGPGDHVAVAGTARPTDDGLVLGGDVHVAVGSLSTAASRYRNRAAIYGVAGVAGVVVGLRALALVLGVTSL